MIFPQDFPQATSSRHRIARIVLIQRARQAADDLAMSFVAGRTPALPSAAIDVAAFTGLPDHDRAAVLPVDHLSGGCDVRGRPIIKRRLWQHY